MVNKGQTVRVVAEMPLGGRPKLNNWRGRGEGVRTEEEAVTKTEPQQQQKTNKQTFEQPLNSSSLWRFCKLSTRL